MQKQISKLHFITQETNLFSHIQIAEDACKAGINWIQLRVKNKPYDEWLTIAKRVKQICDSYNANLIINDNIQIAMAIGAAGVHLGKQDISPVEARKISGKDFIIGGTANTMSDVVRLYASEVNYIGIGPFRHTTTKENLSPILGIYGMATITRTIEYIKLNQHFTIPLIAIGGIESNDIEDLKEKGIYGVAVSGAIAKAENKKEVVEEFKTKFMI